MLESHDVVHAMSGKFFPVNWIRLMSFLEDGWLTLLFQTSPHGTRMTIGDLMSLWSLQLNERMMLILYLCVEYSEAEGCHLTMHIPIETRMKESDCCPLISEIERIRKASKLRRLIPPMPKSNWSPNKHTCFNNATTFLDVEG